MVAVAAGHQHAWLSENEELHWRDQLEGRHIAWGGI